MTSPVGEALADRIRPCGPTLEAPGLATLKAQLVEAGLGPVLDTAWPALAPVFAASPYLASLARRRPEALGEMLKVSPEASLADILMRTGALTGGTDEMKRPLRLAKADLHLLTALADLGGVWVLGAVTGALSRFAGVWVGLKTMKDTVEATAVVDGRPDRMSLVIPEFEMPEGGLNIRLSAREFGGSGLGQNFCAGGAITLCVGSLLGSTQC